MRANLFPQVCLTLLCWVNRIYTDVNTELNEKIKLESLIWEVNLSQRWVLKCVPHLREWISPDLSSDYLRFSVFLFFMNIYIHMIFTFIELVSSFLLNLRGKVDCVKCHIDVVYCLKCVNDIHLCYTPRKVTRKLLILCHILGEIIA